MSMSLQRPASIINILLLILAIGLLATTIVNWTNGKTKLAGNISLTIMPVCSGLQNALDSKRSPVNERNGHLRCLVWCFSWTLGTVIAVLYTKKVVMGLCQLSELGWRSLLRRFSETTWVLGEC